MRSTALDTSNFDSSLVLQKNHQVLFLPALKLPQKKHIDLLQADLQVIIDSFVLNLNFYYKPMLVNYNSK